MLSDINKREFRHSDNNTPQLTLHCNKMDKHGKQTQNRMHLRKESGVKHKGRKGTTDHRKGLKKNDEIDKNR